MLYVAHLKETVLLPFEACTVAEAREEFILQLAEHLRANTMDINVVPATPSHNNMRSLQTWQDTLMIYGTYR